MVITNCKQSVRLSRLRPYLALVHFLINTRREIVSRWRKRFFEKRLAGLEDCQRPGRPRVFPPELVVQVKAMACEFPSRFGVPLSRWSVTELGSQVRAVV